MRIASWSWGGRPQVGTISADGREATPLAVADATRGALPLIEALARGESLPSPSGARLPVEAIELRAPLPRPLRSLFCVGRNYHAHAAELADERLSRQPAGRGRLADRLHQARRLRHRPARRGAPARRGDDEPDRLRERARGRHRPRRPRHRALAGDGPRLRLHDRQRRQRARRPGAPPAVGPRQELRHLLPDGPVDQRAPTSSTAAPRACAAGSTASCARTASRRT